MPTDSMMTLIAALARSDFQAILGTPEGHDVDFKLAPYALDTNKGKWELAKDVAAFANASGGCLVIGVREEQQAHHVAAVAAEVRSVPKTLVNVSRYRDVIASWIVPAVEGVAFTWYPEGDTATEGILLIRVPPQPERVRPFLVTQVVDADGGAVNAVAWPKRNQDRIEWTRPERVQHHLNLAGTLAERISELSVVRTAAPIVDLDAKGNALRLAVGAGEDPCIVVQVSPPAPLDLLTRMFGPDGLLTAVREWKGIRSMGFDITTGNSDPTTENGNLVVNGQVDGSAGWQLRLDTDGLLQLALPFRWHFLGWALRRDSDAEDMNPRINGLVMVEIVLDLFRFLRAQLDSTGTWNGRLSISTMKQFHVELHRGTRRREDWMYRPHAVEATGDEYVQTFSCAGPAERDAFECLQRIYALWGYGSDAIPFTKDGAIVPSALVSLRS